MTNEKGEWKYRVILWALLLALVAGTVLIAVKSCQLDNELDRRLHDRPQHQEEK